MSSDLVSGAERGEPRPMRLSTVPGGTATRVRGYADGYAHGWAAGSQAAAEKGAQENLEQEALAEASRAVLVHRVEQALDVLAEAASAASQRTVPVLAESAELLISGAVDIAEAVLGAELSDHGVAVRAAVGRALRLDGVDRVVRIRLNPQDLAALDELGAIIDPPRIPEEVELVADPELGPGDAISEVGEGLLDARISYAITRVREELGLIGPPVGGEIE